MPCSKPLSRNGWDYKHGEENIFAHTSTSMWIGSIDVGIANMGFAVLDTDTCQVVHLERFDLRVAADGTRRVPFSDKAAVFLVHRALMERRTWFERCTAVCIEKQMMRRMLHIQYIMEALLMPWTTVLQVDARSVKSFAGTGCRKSHAKNKQAAVEAVKQLLDEDGLAQLAQFRKQDDVADALLGAFYGAEHYETLCAVKARACSVGQAAGTATKGRRRRQPATKKRRRGER